METTKLQKQFYDLAEAFSTRDGFSAIAWECFKRLTPKNRKNVIEAMNSGFDSDEDESFVENIAELLR